MRSCTHFKSLIDNAGELDQRQRQTLDSHLETCRDCAEYQVQGERTSATLKELHHLLRCSAATERAYTSFLARLDESNKQMMWGIGGAATCAIALVAIFLRGDLTLVGACILLGVGLLCALFAWWTSRGRMFLHPLKQQAGDFGAEWSTVLGRRIRVTVIVAVLVSAELTAVAGMYVWGGTAFTTPGLPILVGLFLCLGGGVLYTFIIELPQLRRELAMAREIAGE